MAVFRVERNTGYTVMSNHHLRNKELSLKAKGLLSQMLSLPENWDYTLKGLSHINREKIDAIREAIRELEKAGYIVRTRERDEKGRLRGADYVIYEQPQKPKLDLPTLENPTLDNPTLGNPTQEKPTLENPTQLNKDRSRTNLSNTEKSNTDLSSTDSIPIRSPYPSPYGNEPERNGTEAATQSAVDIYREIIMDNIEYDILCQDPKLDKDRLDEIVDIMLSVMVTTWTYFPLTSQPMVARESEKAAKQRYSSRLQFTDEERAAPELQKHIHKAEKAADKLDAAQAAIPKKRVLHKERVFDEASGKGKTKLHFEKVDKDPPKLKPSLLSRPAREVVVFAHGKIHEVEGENVGVESGHKAEELAEHSAGGAVRMERRRRKLKPYRKAAKAERKAANANAEYLYQKVLRDNPDLLSGNPLNQFFRKQRLKREYAKAARTAKNAGSAAQTTAKTTEKAAEATATAAKKVAEKAKQAAEFVVRNWKGVLVVLAGFLLIVMLIGGLQSCSVLFSAAGGGIAASSYQSEDADLLAAEEAYCALEAELQEYLNTYESTHDYDEYHFDLDDIEHDPYVLASILSALHEGAWTIDEVQGTLQMLFDKQYILTETVVKERRYYLETDTWTDEDGNTHTETYRVYYDYYICTVELENFNLSHVPVYIMDEETLL